MAFGYPVLLELAGRRVVVVGEAAVEAGKVEGLLAAGAEVTVVAKGPAAALDRLEGDPRVLVHRRGYGGPADLAGAVLCVASAAEAAVRDAVAADARAAGVLVNVMDDVPNCDFAAPAIVRRGDLVIAIGTGGRAPALASRLRADLAARYGPEWAELLEVVGQVRTATLPSLPDFEDRSRRWKAALNLAELERLIRAGQPDVARPGIGYPPVQGPHLRAGPGDARPEGREDSVSAGPGDARPEGREDPASAGPDDAHPEGREDPATTNPGDTRPLPGTSHRPGLEAAS